MRLLMAAMTVLGFSTPEAKIEEEKKVLSSPQVKKNLLQALSEDPDISSFLHALQTSGWLYRIAEKGPFILFAPSNEAFQQLPTKEGLQLSLPENYHFLVKLATSHILSGNTLPKEGETLHVKALSGQPITLAQKEGVLYINDLEIEKAPVSTGNGLLIKIDEVLDF